MCVNLPTFLVLKTSMLILLNFLNSLKLLSYRPISYKKACIYTSVLCLLLLFFFNLSINRKDDYSVLPVHPYTCSSDRCPVIKILRLQNLTYYVRCKGSKIFVDRIYKLHSLSRGPAFVPEISRHHQKDFDLSVI